jgi:hypothetical protein
MITASPATVINHIGENQKMGIPVSALGATPNAINASPCVAASLLQCVVPGIRRRLEETARGFDP